MFYRILKITLCSVAGMVLELFFSFLFEPSTSFPEMCSLCSEDSNPRQSADEAGQRSVELPGCFRFAQFFLVNL